MSTMAQSSENHLILIESFLFIESARYQVPNKSTAGKLTFVFGFVLFFVFLSINYKRKNKYSSLKKKKKKKEKSY